jgi:hypothetical protein
MIRDYAAKKNLQSVRLLFPLWIDAFLERYEVD